MRIMLVGDRAREHILSEQLARSCELYVAMQRRNPGIEKSSQKFFVCDYSNIEAIGSWAIRERIDIALVTSETAMARGLVDALCDIGINCASAPTSASMVGENTVFALNIMKEAGIPVPRYEVCRDAQQMKRAMDEIPRMVIKPALKVDWGGSRFGDSDLPKKADALRYGKAMMKRQGAVVIEEIIEGESFSIQGLTDGRTLTVMPPVHTAKRAKEGRAGALTEGMGGYSSGRLLPFLKQNDLDDARECLMKLIAALNAKGAKFRGPIRGEFMAKKDGVVMLDAYATFGGVTSLNNLLLLRSQLSEAVVSIGEGSLKPLSFDEKATVVKFLVPKNFPKKTRKSAFGIDERALWDNGAKAYFESVMIQKGKAVTGDGRTLAICASGETLEAAESKSEDAACSIKGALAHRSDIAKSAYLSRQIKHMALLRSQ